MKLGARPQAVLAVLQRGGYWTPRQVADAIGSNVSKAGHSLAGLYAEGKVEREELRPGGGQYRWRAS